LQEKVKSLSVQVKQLLIERETLKAEVEIYRSEAVTSRLSNVSLTECKSQTLSKAPPLKSVASTHFNRAGNGEYVQSNAVTIKSIQESNANPLSCCLSPDDSILATGGADSGIHLLDWNKLSSTATANLVSLATPKRQESILASISCPAPVIALSMAPRNRYLAAGCMDGSVHVWQYEKAAYGTPFQAVPVSRSTIASHERFCKNVAWSHDASLFASAGADKSLRLYRVSTDGFNNKFSEYTTLYLPGPIEAMCFTRDKLICHARGTSYLSFFDLGKDLQSTKVSLNAGVTGGFDDHVSFCVLDLCNHQDKYLAAATDASRNIVMDISSGQIVRDLYGHANNPFANPKIGWSNNGQYVYGNTQDSGDLCIWDVASSKLVQSLKGHSQPIRDMYSSANSNTVVTTAFDKETRIWLYDEEDKVADMNPVSALKKAIPMWRSKTTL
jgi:WD40 repeat protein